MPTHETDASTADRGASTVPAAAPESFQGRDQSSSRSVDVSADPYAGQTAPNGKQIYTPDEAGDNLSRYGVDFMHDNYGVADDGVLTFGFWTYEQFMDSYFFELRYSNGEAFNDDAFYAETYGMFEAFSAQQQLAAAQMIELWDDLINIQIEAAAPGEIADIMFGAVFMSTAAGAHAYFPQAEALDDYYGSETYGLTSGDVMINWYYNSPTGDDGGTIVNRPADTSFSVLDPGEYAWFAITHELGHSLGLAHGGDYDASDDNDGDGEPDPITYEGDAYFYQDSQQYTMMSYFPGTVTGQIAVNWDTGYFAFTQTPGVHDILAVQDIYGVDYGTRSGDTVYGFNSNAGGVFDFTTNSLPIVTIWDGAGNDTLDLSGFDADNFIDINEGAFSSAGYKMTAEQRAMWGEILGIETDEEFAAFFAANGIGPDGRPVDNIAIAYGATIENAIGGTGNDILIGNALNNGLQGGAGNDVIAGGAGQDTMTGGAGADLFVFTADDLGSTDKIRDFDSGTDMIDLTSFEGLDAGDVKISGTNVFVNTDGVKGYDLHIVVQGEQVKITDIAFTDSQINLDNYVPNQDLFLAA